MRWIACGMVVLAMGCGTTDPPPVAASNAQQRFLDVRGAPQMFVVSLQDRVVSPNGVTDLDHVRRIEAWTWVGETSRTAMFDGGFFDSETTMDLGITTAVSPQLSPLDIENRMSMADVRALVGSDGDETSADVGGRELTVVHYDPGPSTAVKAFSFIDDELVVAIVGFAADRSGATP